MILPNVFFPSSDLMTLHLDSPFWFHPSSPHDAGSLMSCPRKSRSPVFNHTYHQRCRSQVKCTNLVGPESRAWVPTTAPCTIGGTGVSSRPHELRGTGIWSRCSQVGTEACASEHQVQLKIMDIRLDLFWQCSWCRRFFFVFLPEDRVFSIGKIFSA